jgi:hypothetical protein
MYLLALVVAIYAVIGIRFLILSNDGNEDLLQNFSTPEFIAETAIKNREFEILNNYRDPFQVSKSKSNSGKSIVRMTSSVKTNKENKERDTVIFPEIRYKGLVSDANGSEQIFALEINKQEYILSLGKVMNKVEIVKGSASEIIVKCRNIERSFKLN